MQAVPISKQVNRVNIEPETGLSTGSIMKYNFFVNPFTLTSSFVTIHYNAGHTYTMQELVKEVTLIKHSNNDLQFCMELIKLSP